VTRERLYLDTMQQILTNTTKIIVDQKGGQNLLYLPLDRLMQMSAQGAPSGITVESALPPKPASAPEPGTAAATESARPREALRSREREAR
jgi:membrane protease subunit HflK